MHFMAFREKVDQGDDDEGKESGRGEAADEDDAHGLAEFCACAYAESDGEHAQKCGKGGHEDGAQPEGAGFQYGIFQRHAPCSCPVGVVDEENGIFCDKSQEHGKTDEGHHVGCLVCCEEAEDGADNGKRKAHHDNEGLCEAFKLRGKHHVDQNDG